MDKLYYERANGRWESWAYSDGRRYYVLNTYDLCEIEAYAKRHNIRLVEVI